MASSVGIVAVGLSALLSSAPGLATLQEQIADAVAAHDFVALTRAASALASFPNFAVSASALRDFAAMGQAGESASPRCLDRSASGGARYYAELSRLLERSLRFHDAADCLVTAAALEATPPRRLSAVRSLLKAGRDSEAVTLLPPGEEPDLRADAERLAARVEVHSVRWPALRWSASGEDAAAFGAEVERAYTVFAEATGLPLTGGLTVERLDAALRRRTRFGDEPSAGAVGVTVGGLVSVDAGLPLEVEREVIWHEVAHAFASEELPYGGSPWLSEAVAFAWSRSLLPEFDGGEAATVTVGRDWLSALASSDTAPLSGDGRAARDGLAAWVGCWFSHRFGVSALRVAYRSTGRGIASDRALSEASGLSQDELTHAFLEDALRVSRPTGRTGP